MTFDKLRFTTAILDGVHRGPIFDAYTILIHVSACKERQLKDLDGRELKEKNLNTCEFLTVMEQEQIKKPDQENQDQKMEQINQESQQINQQIVVKKSVTVSHRKDNYGEYVYTKIYISAVAELELNGQLYKFYINRTIDANLHSNIQEVIEKLDRTLNEVEQIAKNHAQLLFNLDQGIKSYLASRTDVEVQFK